MPAPLRRLLVLLACAVTVGAGLTALGPSAAARTPKAPRHFSSTIEDLASYVGQTSCDPHIKRGTKALANLLTTTYSGTSWMSTYACGTDGSQSEHYEGRAIDWMVSATQHKTRVEARSFLKWLLAPDRYGNAHAMARRLGVMYVIFNNRMWGSWSGRWEEYNGCAAKKMQKAAYDNYCHRTHVHISLSWNGARGKTSFWTGRVYPTDYGPCVKKGHKYAPAWTKPNRTGCPGQWH